MQKYQRQSNVTWTDLADLCSSRHNERPAFCGERRDRRNKRFQEYLRNYLNQKAAIHVDGMTRFQEAWFASREAISRLVRPMLATNARLQSGMNRSL